MRDHVLVARSKSDMSLAGVPDEGGERRSSERSSERPSERSSETFSLRYENPSKTYLRH